MSNWVIGTVTLPGDLQWIDEAWTERKQSESLSLAGGTIIQTSTQTTGRPITLVTDNGAYVTRQQVLDLIAFRDLPDTDTFTVTHPDGRTFTCRFRHGDGLPIDASNAMFRSPPEALDRYDLTLRLMTT